MNKLRRTSRSWTTRAAAAISLAVTIATVLQDSLPLLKDLLTPWTYAGVAIGTALVVAVLRVRQGE